MIVAQVKMKTGEHDETRVRTAVHDACANLLDKRGKVWPGDWWAEQIVLEAVRLLQEKP